MYQTLATEKAGYEMTLTWRSEAGEEPTRLDLAYADTQLDTFEMNEEGYPLPLIRRERVVRTFSIAPGQVLLIGSQRSPSSAKDVPLIRFLKKKDDSLSYRRRVIWFVPQQ